ncbi:MAG: hypothetical protein U0893_14625 [Chloroflexota bacterium]
MAALLAAILTAAVAVPRWGAGVAVAAPAMIETAFRDLPATVRTGDPLRVQVDVQDGSSCQGNIVYRDNSQQALKQVDEKEGRCRWDVVVPLAVRRGDADISVTVKRKDEKTDLSATFQVTLRADDVPLMLKDLPGSVKRNSKFTIRLDVPDKATCQGQVKYEDGKIQPLDTHTEDNEECRWEVTVPADVDRGTATLTITVTQDGRPTTIMSSFDVSRGTNDADLLVAFQDLPTTVRRDSQFTVRVLAPTGSRCKGDVSFRSAENLKLDEIHEQGGLCRWTMTVPDDAKRGDSKVSVTVTADGKDTSITGLMAVDETPVDVSAKFKDLPDSIRRGDDLEIRVLVPDTATCQGDVTFPDGTVTGMDGQTEKKGRCLWSVRTPASTPRGASVIRVVVNDHGDVTTLTGNVTIEARDDEPMTATWGKIPSETKRGDKFEISAMVPGGSTCTGRISFQNGMRWTLGNIDEDGSYCTWKVEVPPSAGFGTANVEVKIEQPNGSKSALTGQIDVKSAAAPATTAAPAVTSTPATTTTPLPANSVSAALPVPTAPPVVGATPTPTPRPTR